MDGRNINSLATPANCRAVAGMALVVVGLGFALVPTARGRDAEGQVPWSIETAGSSTLGFEPVIGPDGGLRRSESGNSEVTDDEVVQPGNEGVQSCNSRTIL